jgi:uncharacterized membrane protein
MQLKKLLTLIARLIIGIFAFAYPFVVFFALRNDVAVKFIGLFLLAVIVVSFVRHRNKILLGLGLILCSLILFFNQDIFLKIYPVLMNCSIFAIFALSLQKTPLITQYAKRMNYDLNAKVIKYTRNATIAWAIFMGCNSLISLVTVFLSNKIWVLYNGFISYILIGIMMIGEYITRKWILHVESDK